MKSLEVNVSKTFYILDIESNLRTINPADKLFTLPHTYFCYCVESSLAHKVIGYRLRQADSGFQFGNWLVYCGDDGLGLRIFTYLRTLLRRSSSSSCLTLWMYSMKKARKMAKKQATVTERMQIRLRLGFTFLLGSGAMAGSKTIKL